MRADLDLIHAKMPSFGSRLAQAMTYRRVGNAELTARLRQFGLEPADNYAYRLTSITRPANPTLITLAGLRDALAVSGEWWFDPTLTANELPNLDLMKE